MTSQSTDRVLFRIVEPSILKKNIARILCSIFFVSVGITHFTDPNSFMHIMPPYLPYPLALVYVSGALEILGGAGLLWSKTRTLAAWGLIALLIAVYPANIHMLINDVYLPDMPQEKWILWARMPVQLVFAAWVLCSTEVWPKPDGSDAV
jgi:uncharacterized membrane protein